MLEAMARHAPASKKRSHGSRTTLFKSCVLILCLTGPWCLPAQTPAPVLKVLIINSWHQGFAWTDTQMQGILAALQESPVGQRLDIYRTWLDQRRLPEKKQIISRFLDEVMQYQDLDLIIATDNPAYELARGLDWRLDRHVPLVFCGVNNFQASDLAAFPYMTGVAENFLSGRSDTIRAALALQPDTTRCLFILDQSETGQAIGAEIQAIENQFPGISFEYRTEEILDRQIALIQSQPDHTLVFPIGIHRDQSGILLEYEPSLEQIVRATRLPCYGFIENRIGHGLVGGKILTGYDHGHAAGVLAGRILAGEPVGGLPPVLDNPGRFHFDWNQLQRFGLQDRPLPPGSVLINQPDDAWSRYGGVIITSLVVALSLLGLSLSLVINRHHLLQVQHHLTASQASLQTSLGEKETLLRELHHRTQNNLYVIYSLLTLHAEDTGSPAARAALTDMAGRVQAMSLVHQRLSRLPNLAAIDMRGYVTELVELAGGNNRQAAIPVNVNIEVADISLPLDTAVPVGLVLNELINNAWHHAFANPVPAAAEAHCLTIRLKCQEERHVQLEVIDSGPGLGHSFNMANDGHMGLQTVKTLVEKQLNGHLAIRQTPGFHWLIDFEVEIPPGHVAGQGQPQA